MNTTASTTLDYAAAMATFIGLAIGQTVSVPRWGRYASERYNETRTGTIIEMRIFNTYGGLVPSINLQYSDSASNTGWHTVPHGVTLVTSDETGDDSNHVNDPAISRQEKIDSMSDSVTVTLNADELTPW